MTHNNTVKSRGKFQRSSLLTQSSSPWTEAGINRRVTVCGEALSLRAKQEAQGCVTSEPTEAYIVTKATHADGLVMSGDANPNLIVF